MPAPAAAYGVSEAMLDIAIIGAGVSGLRLADLLRDSGLRIGLYDARARTGGRVLGSADGLDLGPTWYWPRTQPRIGALLAELGLRSLAQHDDGRVLELADPNRTPETREHARLHDGARRVAGGMSRLVDALAARLPQGCLHLEQRLLGARRHQDHVELQLRHGAEEQRLTARHLVLALPPRLIDETIVLAPALPATLGDALRATPTWMASAAKATMRYERAFWREAGHSGNAFVTHAQAVLCEVFDACDPEAGAAALAGFVELDPARRLEFARGMPMLLRSQLAQLFGPPAEHGQLHYYDWAQDALSCAQLDRAIPLAQHPDYGDARLAAPLWDGRLHLCGSETARDGGGYLEGALNAAARLAARLRADAIGLSMPEPGNDIRLARFSGWVRRERDALLAQYRGELHRRLAAQDTEAVTQQSLLAVVESLYTRALDEIGALGLSTAALAVIDGRSELTPRLLEPFMGLSDRLLDEAGFHNASSCALSNFPFEHRIDAGYRQAIRRDLAAAWRAFALAVNERALPVSLPTVH
jgi:monoamine oxidase